MVKKKTVYDHSVTHWCKEKTKVLHLEWRMTFSERPWHWEEQNRTKLFCCCPFHTKEKGSSFLLSTTGDSGISSREGCICSARWKRRDNYQQPPTVSKTPASIFPGQDKWECLTAERETRIRRYSSPTQKLSDIEMNSFNPQSFYISNTPSQGSAKPSTTTALTFN